MHASGLHQRSIYKLIDKILSAEFKKPIDLLISLVRDIVDSGQFVMTGGRVWELDDAEDTYTLCYQEGEMEFLNVGTKRSVVELPVMVELAARKTLVSTFQSDDGIRIYSLTGVGDTVKRPSGSLYKYALAFTAHTLDEEFYDTMVVIGSAATTALRNMQAAQREKRMRKDLDQAWEIQQGLVPDHATTFHDFDIYGISVPESVVGGDYFDYLYPPEEEQTRLGLVISDAASKGLPAAVQALFVSGALRMAIQFQTRISTLIQRLNWLIFDTFPNERFVTLCYCELSKSSNGLVLYANAGHCPPIHYIAATGQVEYLMPTGGILGIVEEQPFGVENVNLRANDILVLYTDGLTEAQNDTGAPYGEERIVQLIRDHKDSSAEIIAQLLLADVQTYSARANYSDDKTLIVVKRRGSQTASPSQPLA